VLQDGQVVTAAMLPPILRSILSAPDYKTPATCTTEKSGNDTTRPLWRVERDAIENAIALCKGNIPKAAAILEISPSTIYRKKMLWDKHPRSSISQGIHQQYGSPLDRPRLHS
jgi:two-component system repressor protein LuxO